MDAKQLNFSLTPTAPRAVRQRGAVGTLKSRDNEGAAASEAPDDVSAGDRRMCTWPTLLLAGCAFLVSVAALVSVFVYIGIASNQAATPAPTPVPPLIASLPVQPTGGTAKRAIDAALQLEPAPAPIDSPSPEPQDEARKRNFDVDQFHWRTRHSHRAQRQRFAATPKGRV